MALVGLLSLLPWHDLTGGVIKDFDLFGDLRPDSTRSSQVAGNEFVDPTLVAEIQEAAADTLHKTDSITTTQSVPPAISSVPVVVRENGEIIIEDYTAGKTGLQNLKKALARNRARIAVIGDSYIEGDILTQDIRSQLQTLYGGRGVGYVPAHSQVAGFRRTVNIKDEGWTQYDVQKASHKPHFNIAGEYFMAPAKATTKYTGYSKDSRLASWDKSSFLFIAPKGGNIIMATDSTAREFTVSASEEPQFLVMNEPTTSLKIDTQIPGLIFLGTWLEGNSGVTVDCMSNRGDSGASHRKINADLAALMRQHVNYDLIIVEYGINALTADQYNYNAYGNLMRQVCEQLRLCYPNADILMLGIGDRGQKIDGAVHSLPSAPAMVAAQRQAARDAGVLFWDTREAMGGQDAVVDWRNRKLVNGDFIHLNSAGGRELATLLVNSIKKMLSDE